jgi:hypothetical protein
MMSRLPMCATMLVVAMAAAQAAEVSKSVNLKMQVLPGRDVLTPTGVREGFVPAADGKMMMRSAQVPAISNGAVWTREIKFKDSTTLSIGEAELSLTVPGPSSLSMAMGGGKPVLLKALLDGWQTVPVPISKKGRLMLALPHGQMSSRSGAVITYHNAGVASGKLDADTLFVYDDTCDGLYGASDAISLNSGFVYAPIPELIAGKKNVWQVGALAEDGSKAAFTAVDEPTGKLQVTYTTPAGEGHLFLQGGKVTVLSAGPGKDPVTALPGDYALQYGLLLSQKREVVAACIPGASKPVTVTADGTATAAFGAPFRFEFTVQKVKEKFVISPGSIRLYGVADEQYIGYVFKPPPTVLVNGKKVGAFGFG